MRVPGAWATSQTTDFFLVDSSQFSCFDVFGIHVINAAARTADI